MMTALLVKVKHRLNPYLSREAQLLVGWVSGSVTWADVGFHASTQPTLILYLIPPTYLIEYFSCKNKPHLSQKSYILRCTSVNLRVHGS